MGKVFIIAEAGVNHNGKFEIAKKMVDIAAESGADAIKFQTFISERCVTKNAMKAHYQKETTDSNQTQFDMVKKLELSFDEFVKLKEYCEEKKIMFLSTAFDIDSLNFLNSIGLDIYKIPSGEITNLPLLKAIGKLKKKVIVSTGMSSLEEIKLVVNILNKYGTEDIVLLHCTTQYPAPMEDVNLKAMVGMKEELKLPVGYSDHTQGIEVSIAAVALGATVIEKHFTLDRNMDGPDHKASIEPYELRSMVQAIRNIEKALGRSKKEITASEIQNKNVVRKSIVAASRIKKGECFTEQNLTTKRPGTGISPMEWERVIGTYAIRDFEADELIEV